MTTCAKCNCRLNWREERRGVCRIHDPEAIKTGKVPDEQFCMHRDRCDGLSSCPRDHVCND